MTEEDIRMMYEWLEETKKKFGLDSCSEEKEPRKPRTVEEMKDLHSDFVTRVKSNSNLDEDLIEERDPESPIRCIQMLGEECKFVRVYLNDEIPEGLTTYKCDEDGSSWLVGTKSCFCCKHCTDVWLDWYGPYGFICTKGKNICAGCIEECSHFEEDPEDD